MLRAQSNNQFHMKITSFPKIARYRIFKNFVWPTDLLEFNRFNLFFAPNGSGKTTLSCIFQNLERKEDIPALDGDVRINIDGNTIKGTDISSAQLPPIRVFNKDLVKRSIFEDASGELPPVFYLGEDSAQKQKRIAELTDLAAQFAKDISAATQLTKASASVIETHCIATARTIKDQLTAPGSSYNSYDKAAYRKTVEAMRKDELPKTVLPRPHYERLLVQIREVPHDELPVLTWTAPDFSDLTIRTEALLARTVVSQLLDDLVGDAAVSEWVNQGLALHKDSPRCRFCGEVFSAERRAALEGHFNAHYRRFQEDLEKLDAELLRSEKHLDGPVVPAASDLYKNFNEQLKGSLSKLTKELADAKTFIASLQHAISEKRRTPFSALDLKQFPANPPTMTAVDEINKIIGEHNARVQNHATEVITARTSIEHDDVAASLSDYESKAKDQTEKEAEQLRLQELLAHNNAEAQALRAEIQTHHRPAEELNEEIKSYLGTNELSFETRDAGYRITRDGQPARHLSEGEKTAIALLYFLKSLSDTGFDLANGVVVIDDPVSSMDANSIYCAFGYIKARTHNAGQLFVSTHNLTFFRLMKNWFNHATGNRSRNVSNHTAHFYMLRTLYGADGRSSVIAILDPLLHRYESEYHYLFQCVVEASLVTTTPSDLSVYYGATNIARRVMESFLAFRYPHMGDDNLQNRLEALPTTDPVKKTRVLRLLHVGSHSDDIGEPEHDISILAEAPAVLRDLLDMMKDADPDHFDGMMQKINATAPVAAATPAAATPPTV
jgi:wobble nucleotide-excising tRNase